jgi:hypothetical protein
MVGTGQTTGHVLYIVTAVITNLEGFRRNFVGAQNKSLRSVTVFVVYDLHQ